MYTDDYRNFKEYIPADRIKQLGRHLSFKVRRLADEMFGGPDISKSEALEAFFTEVMRISGEWTKHQSDYYFDNLIKAWGVGTNKSLIIATYHYLHTTRFGHKAALEADRLIFGQTFQEKFGFPAHGGYAPNDAEIVVSVTHELSALVRRIEAAQDAGVERASFEMLLSIAREYEASHQATDQSALRKYITEKIEEWRAYREKIAAMDAIGADSRKVLADAKSATDQGEFDKADALLADTLRRRYEIHNAEKASICELLEIRARNASIGGKEILAYQYYQEASDIMSSLDSRKSFYFSHHAANALYQRSFSATDVSIFDVASAFRVLVEKSKHIPPDSGWTKAAPLISYCSVLNTIYSRHKDHGAYDEAENTARSLIEDYTSSDDAVLLANLRSILAGILTDGKHRADYPKRLAEAIELHFLAMDCLDPVESSFYWRRAQMKLGLTLMQAGKLEGQINLMRFAVLIFYELIKHAPPEDNSEVWSRARHNMGACQVFIGEAKDKPQLIFKALSNYDKSLLHRQKELHPILFARTRAAIGDALFCLATKFNQEKYFDESIAAYVDALSAWDIQNFPQDYKMISEKLKFALTRRAD